MVDTTLLTRGRTTGETARGKCCGESAILKRAGCRHFTPPPVANSFPPHSWCYFDDSSVTQAKPSQVGGKEAYVLYYRRREEDGIREGVGRVSVAGDNQ